MTLPSFFETPSSYRAARVLVVGGQNGLDGQWSNLLNRHGLAASFVHDRATLLNRLKQDEPDLVLLGRRSGLIDGFDTLQEIRRRSTVPVIVADGHPESTVDRVLGLELGADDYVAMPFDPRELLARIRAVLRRIRLSAQRPERPRRYAIGALVFDQRARSVEFPDGERAKLTKGEFTLLCAFVEAPRRILSRAHLLHATRMHEDINDRSIDVQIMRLRRRLRGRGGGNELIRTERSAGYVLDANVEMLWG